MIGKFFCENGIETLAYGYEKVDIDGDGL